MIADSGIAQKEGDFIDAVLPELTANSSTNISARNQACLKMVLEESSAMIKDTGPVAVESDAVGANTKNAKDGGEPSVALQNAKKDLAMEENGSLKPDSHEFQDLKLMYEHEGDWDNEEDDKDWDPDEKVELVVPWFCTNCIDSNADEDSRCQQCGEHRYSGILEQGFMAPMQVSDKVDATMSRRINVGPEATADKLAITLPSCLSPQTDSQSTAIGFDERMLLHSEVRIRSQPHPERPDRLRAIMAGLNAAGLLSKRCCTIPSREATIAEMESVHARLHVDAVEATSSQEASSFGRDTYANSHSALAARLAAGICVDLATAIVKGQVLNGFALVRPPGHHAMHATAMGFCLHNNAAIAAKAALTAGAKKVLIVDWDVHHGNGTQEIFNHDTSVLYVSLHRHQGGLFYPGTGAATEVGFGDGEGYSVNIPWPCGGIGDEDYLFAFQNIVLPIAVQFGPDITIISAGFDAAKGDPLGGCQVTPPGYAHMTQMLYSLMKGRLLVVLEGGYNLRSISASAAAVLKVLSGEFPEEVPSNHQPTYAGLVAVLEACHAQARYWKFDAMAILKMRVQLASAQARLKGKHGNRQGTRGPVWWKWGRKRVVYDHCFSMPASR